MTAKEYAAAMSGKLEEGAHMFYGDNPDELVTPESISQLCLQSIAISLKRLADSTVHAREVLLGGR